MLKKPPGKDQMNIDRISTLPYDVLDSILVHMPLKEAVRTSVLSTKWRRQWTRLSQFSIDDKIFPDTMLDRDARWRVIANILRQIQLSNTNGPVEKFKLAAYCCPDHSVLLELVAFLFRKCLKEFVLQAFVSSKRFEFPLCSFSCGQLSRLELFRCALEIPESCDFEGFCSLMSLKLSSVRVDCETLQHLVSKCPVLESLTLLDLNDSILLRLHGTRLKYLKIASVFEDICLNHNPFLAHVDVRMKVPVVSSSRIKASSLVRIVGCLRGLKRLAITNEFVEFLGRRGVPEMLPSLLENLTVLELREVRAENLNHIKVFLCLLKSTPNLEELYISFGGRSTGSLKRVFDFVEEQSHDGLYFNRLKVVKITGIWHFTLAEYFLGLILAHSPLLETLTLIHYDGEMIPYELFKEFHYASEHVKITTLVSASC